MKISWSHGTDQEGKGRYVKLWCTAAPDHSLELGKIVFYVCDVFVCVKNNLNQIKINLW